MFQRDVTVRSGVSPAAAQLVPVQYAHKLLSWFRDAGAAQGQSHSVRCHVRM